MPKNSREPNHDYFASSDPYGGMIFLLSFLTSHLEVYAAYIFQHSIPTVYLAFFSGIIPDINCILTSYLAHLV